MTDEKAPCPFCGETVHLYVTYQEVFKHQYVHCGNCFVHGPVVVIPNKRYLTVETHYRAIALWNKRTPHE